MKELTIEDEKIRKALIRFHKSTIDIDGIKGEDIIAWLEKQGEQKSYGQRQECVDCQFNYAGECKGSCAMKRGEQKSVNTVETKFKVGDWLVHNERKNIIKVVNATPLIYKVVDVLGYHHTITDTAIENNYHPWTIQDAKDGDVLYAKGSYFKEYLFMFSSFTEDNVISTHFGYDVFHGTFDKKLTRFGREKDFMSVTPATQEQRSLLFQKMHEAGYEWDDEKKELKKIEQKPAEWGKEDEYMIENICHAFEKGSSQYIWLTSLKERIQFQNTITDEELAQAKKDAYNEALDKIEYHSGEPTFDDGWSAAIWYLKKRNLLPQNVWKPSDEQIKALSYYLKNDIDNEGVFGRQLVKLYQDLLKLMDE